MPDHMRTNLVLLTCANSCSTVNKIFVSFKLDSLFPLSLPSFLSSFLPLCFFLTIVASCVAQKIKQLIIRHFIWQSTDYVCTQSPIHMKVSRDEKR